jgi:hypothetical protein
MKDIVIPGRRIKKELWIFAALFFFFIIVNFYAIVVHDGAWKELATQLHIVIALTVLFYVAAGIVRIIVHLITGRLKRGVAETQQ